MLGLLVAAVAGGLAGYYWRDNIRERLSNGAPELRQRAAEGLGVLGERASGALDRARSSIDTTIRSSQERLRAGTTGGATGTTGGSAPKPAPGFAGGYDQRRGAGSSGGPEHHQ